MHIFYEKSNEKILQDCRELKIRKGIMKIQIY